MIGNAIKVLLIAGSPADAEQVRAVLGGRAGIEVESAEGLVAGIDRLNRRAFDGVVLDLSGPEAGGSGAIVRLVQSAPGLPIIVLGAPGGDLTAEAAFRSGAADYLEQGSLGAGTLERAIRYAFDRCATCEELARARDSALQSARLRSEFLANMSHAIRTPLNGIVGMSRLLIDTRLGREQREMVEIVRQSADTLVKIVADVLDFSRLAAGRVSLEENDFELHATVDSVITLCAEQARHKGVELASYVDSEVPGTLNGDPGRLCQVLMNLVANAVKFTPNGEVTLRVGLVSEDATSVTLRFAVKDTGVGIPLQEQRQLFQAYGRGEAATTRRMGGSGLGLAICAQLVELMGGNIGVESATGEGSLFWFTAILRKRSGPATQEAPPAAALEGLRILICDQSPTATRLVQEHAQAWGIACETAANPAQTMAILKSAASGGHPYDLVLIEIPGRGLTLGRAIRADATLADTHVVGMYALGERPDERRLRAAGIRATLAKPIKQGQLFNTLSLAKAARGAPVPPNRCDEPRGRRQRLHAIESALPADLRARTRILLVEDNPVNQRVQIRMLERIGFHADTVNNGQEALMALGRHPYDIVLMDCQMPGMDGFRATREIRRRETNGHHTVIIGVTAQVFSGDREECLATGMDDYVSKPVAPEDLAATLEKWVGQVTSP